MVNKNIAIVSSKGGHLGQMKLFFTDKVIRKDNCILITEENTPGIKENGFLNKFRVYFFRKDYLGTNPFRYLATIRSLMCIFRKEKIDVIFTNGAHISIPAVIAGRLLRIKTVFIDTVVRVKTPNWSARISYPFSNIFWVQHESMARKYGRKARYIGGIV